MSVGDDKQARPSAVIAPLCPNSTEHTQSSRKECTQDIELEPVLLLGSSGSLFLKHVPKWCGTAGQMQVCAVLVIAAEQSPCWSHLPNGFFVVTLSPCGTSAPNSIRDPGIIRRLSTAATQPEYLVVLKRHLFAWVRIPQNIQMKPRQKLPVS